LLDVPRTKLYYHVRLLDEHELITVEDTRIVSGITEKRYRLTAYRLSVDKAMLGVTGEAGSPLEVYLSVVFDEVTTEIRRAIASSLIDLEQTYEDTFKPRRLVVGRHWYRFTDEDVAEFDRRYTELQNAFVAKSVYGSIPEPDGMRSEDGKLYEVLIGFYPVLPPGDASNGDGE
jgi:hypothetical protein